MTVGRTRGRVLVAVAALGVLLTGCSGQPGAAAVVDGRTITTAEVAQAREELAPIFQQVAASDVLQALILEPFVTQIAAERGVGVNDAEALDLVRSSIGQVVGEKEAASLEFGSGALAIARYSLALTALQDLPDAQEAASDYTERLAAADVEVNPRFGTFTEDLAVTPPETPSWIVPEGGRNAPAEETPAEGDAPADGDAPVDGEAP